MVATQTSARNFDLIALTRSFGLYAAPALSLAAAGIHLWVMPEHFVEWWGYGLLFAALALSQGLFGVALLRWPVRPLFLAGIAGNLAVTSFYIITRTAGIPFIGPHAGEVHAAGALDLFSIAFELALVVTLVALAGEAKRARIYLALGAGLALAAGAAIHIAHSGMHEAFGLNPVTHWLQTSALMLPLAVLAIWTSTYASRCISTYFFGESSGSSARVTWSLSAATIYALVSIPADAIAAQHANGTFLEQAARNAGVTLLAGFLGLLAIATLRGMPYETPRTINLFRPQALTAASGLVAGVLMIVGPGLLGGNPSPAEAQAAPSCSGSSYDRSYDVAAINVEIPFNRFAKITNVAGETVGENIDPHGQIFVLQGDKKAVKNWHMQLGATPAEDPAGANNRRLRPRPLVIRANPGECVKVDLTNELDEVQGDGLPNNPRVGMKVYGPSYDAQTSDGSSVGYNKDTTVGRNETISMYWKAPSQEGTFLFRDQATLSGSEANSGSTGHGLHGAFVVEPSGSTWKDPETGQPLYNGDKNHDRLTKQSGEAYIDANIVTAAGAFRETVQISQDELPGGNGFAFNYGGEPARNRIAVNPAGENPAAEQTAPDAVGEETSLSSWTYGDPALIKLASGKGPWLPDAQRKNREDCGLANSCYVSNVTHAYPRDPTKIRFAHAGVKETHVFHLHANQWRVEPNDPKSTIIDSQTYGPGESFSAELIGGAGSKPGTVGDSIFHCHLYPHFADGFWSLLRVHDVLEDGSEKLPDGTKVREIQPLPDRASPSAPTAQKPGYPRFMPGKYGWRAPQPPLGVSEQKAGVSDDPATVQREDLKPATRVVAGKPLDQATLDGATDPISTDLADKLRLEQNAMKPNAKPGAPFTEPCPTGSREVTYNVSAIQTDVVYNERGDHDTQGRIMVPTEDVEEIIAGTKKPEPLFIRVTAGDCVNFNLTNYLPNWFGGDAFVDLAQTNMTGGHVHLVKFDVLASDGSSNGWNYQQAAFSKEQAEFNERAVAGEESCDWSGCRVPDPTDWDPTTKTDPLAPGQTISERWYADTELRTVFTHDHHFAALDQNRGYFGALIVEPKGMDFRNPKNGKFYQPGNGSTPGAKQCGDQCTGDAAGTAMDIIGSGPNDDFREFGLAVQDFVSLTKKGGDPKTREGTVNSPAAPEEFPDADPGVMGINYSNAPFQLRDRDRAGNSSDPAHVFSSTVHGDPATPILQTYTEDPVRIRTIQGSQEEQHVLTMNGIRWREEPDDPNSPLINSKAIGVSEAFNFEVPKISCAADERSCAGDYLYGGTATDDAYLGAWGILRARGSQVPSLLPLPDNPRAADATVTTPESTSTGSPTATTPPESNAPGASCPTGAPVKKYEVVAMQAKLKYNKDGDNDPNGLIYALASDEASIKNGSKEPEPLVLRASEGDCIEVGLTNHVGAGWRDAHGNAGTAGDPTLPTEPPEGTKAGLRASLHPQLVKYDVRGSDGTAVGYNRDQTVAPGDRKLYRWYADDVSPGELGTTNLTDFGDVRGHRHHGLFAGLNIEPKGSTYHDPETGAPVKSGVSADIRVPGPNNDFREFTTFFQDGLNLHDKTGAPIEDALDHPPTPEEPDGEPMDAEDQGEKGFNYTNAPFDHRLSPEQMGPDGIHPVARDGRSMADVFSSKVHGDPDTPIFRAYAGDRMRMRVLQGSDKPRQHSYQISGQSWKSQPDDPNSNLIGTQGGISVGRTFNLNLSPFDNPGDYRYGCGVGFHHLSGGLWGIMRVYQNPSPASALNPTNIGNVDDPHAGGNPLMPLEVSNKTTTATLSAAPTRLESGGVTKLSGKLSTSDGPLSGRSVVVEHKPSGAAKFAPAPNGQVKTDANGTFSLANVKPAKTTEYRASFAGNPDTGFKASTSAVKQVVVVGGAAIQANASQATVSYGKTTAISGILGGDGRKLVGKTVTLEQKPIGKSAFVAMPGGGLKTRTDAQGRFSFKGVKPSKNTTYRASFAGDTNAGLRAASATLTVKVKALVSLNMSTKTLKSGESRKISGAVTPAHSGKATVTIKRNGKQVLSKKLALKGSRYTLGYKPRSTGSYKVQVKFAGDRDHLGGVSATKSFEVRR